ncbi:MAG: aminopeptidase P family protein [Deltaproteobacteria bacterium]|nr:aminopeptidase P family protein [Deltaproteobacteria bacterium]
MNVNATTGTETFRARRRALLERLERPVLLAAGEAPSRNYAANRYAFRASSHFLYFVGRPLAGSALLFRGGRATLFTHPPDPEDALWHGPRPELATLGVELGLTEAHGDVRPLGELPSALAELRDEVATLPTQDAPSAAWLSQLLGRTITPRSGARLDDGRDAELADALIALRLTHDAGAVAQLRFAAACSAEAHLAGMRATRPGGTEHDVHAAMVGTLRRHGLEDAYGPIVTVHGEVLHSDDHTNALRSGDLLLADVGGETREGWAADITRVWPVSGAFSKTQRALYDVVLEAQLDAIAAVLPGRRYRDVHEVAKRAIVLGLVKLGILRGDVDGLLERGAAALFFPHGIGHLLGLDVHDMEDLGDRAGYASGRSRSTRFGDGYLRLDRDLAPGMAVTIEPGFYQVPGILGDARLTGPLGDDLRRDVLAHYADVRGIRIEDDVLVTEGGHEVLTSGVPKLAAEVEAIVRGA